jgi:SH3-like domain-containing protein
LALVAAALGLWLASSPAWSPTHEVKRPAQAWAQPDPGGAVVATLEQRLSVQVIERQGDWARILCSNGWSAWIDSRKLKLR